jgi:membrane-bound lytic murein transglycosylase D
VLWAAVLAASLAGCAKTIPVRDTGTPDSAAIAPATAPVAAVPAPQAAAPQPTPAAPVDFWQRLRSGFALPPTTHPKIDYEVARLQRAGPGLQALLEQGRPFLRLVLDEVERRGLPSEIALLPAVESGFRPTAYSPNGAAGLWQFMPATARRFELVQDWWYDGRRDPAASTQAALDYLEHLLKRFDGDWLHALAAYNAGGGTVSRAIRKNRERDRATDFWSLDLPGETDDYVPRLLALARVIADPAAAGVALPGLPDEPEVILVDAGAQIDLRVAARLAEVPLEEFLHLNAGYNRAATRPDGPHHLLVPSAAAARLQSALADLPAEQWLRWERHRIRSGDTLSGIAQRYGVSVATIKRANRLRSDRIRAGRALLIPLSEAEGLQLAQAALAPTRINYRVRKGDSLYLIARRFDVSVAELQRWNAISGRLIKPGQRLTIHVNAEPRTL